MDPKRLKKRGLLFVVSAPSGCGKTTICKRLVLTVPRLVSSRSVTTRSRRGDETDGRDYYFISNREFAKKRRNGELLEWAKNFGNYYGTPRKPVEEAAKNGKDVLLAIDVKGASKIRKKAPRSVHIFIMPPSPAVLKKRLRKRGTDTDRVIQKRLKIARMEMARAKYYDYVIVNESVKKAVSEIKAIIMSERRKTKRR